MHHATAGNFRNLTCSNRRATATSVVRDRDLRGGQQLRGCTVKLLLATCRRMMTIRPYDTGCPGSPIQIASCIRSLGERLFTKASIEKLRAWELIIKVTGGKVPRSLCRGHKSPSVGEEEDDGMRILLPSGSHCVPKARARQCHAGYKQHLNSLKVERPSERSAH